MTLEVELLWFQDCPNHPAARASLEAVIAEIAPGTPIREVDATDPATAAALRFPGSPTIRVGGRDIDPGYIDPGDYTPRCRLYRTSEGLRGLPERRWIEDALRQGGLPRRQVDQGDESAALAGRDGGKADQLIGATIVAGAACCAIALAATAGLVLPIAGIIAGGVSVVAAGAAVRRGSIRPAERR